MTSRSGLGINQTHGATVGGKRTPEYITWLSMRQRCCDPSHTSWKNYGARGVTVCERWKDSFENFLADLGPKPSRKHSLDRITATGNYEPGNCRWTTHKEQQNNRRNNRCVEIDGTKMTLAEAAAFLNVPYRTFANRFDKYIDGLITYDQLVTEGNRTFVLLPSGETITQAAKRLGVTPPAIRYRLNRVAAGKMSIAEALGTHF